MGKSESYTYDGVGNKTGFVNKAGNQWTYEYDAAGRLVIERTPQTNIVETLSLIHISTTARAKARMRMPGRLARRSRRSASRDS